MSLFHRHLWKVTGSSYTEPVNWKAGDYEGSRYGLDELIAAGDRCRRGETHIYTVCAICGQINSVTVPGKWPGETDPKRFKVRYKVFWGDGAWTCYSDSVSLDSQVQYLLGDNPGKVRMDAKNIRIEVDAEEIPL